MVIRVLELSNEDVDENIVIKRKGMLRKELLKNDTLDSFITAKEAVKIKKRYFG